jgi:hypothetical protein
MSRRSTFKQAEITKALKGALAAGMKPSGYRIDPMGGIVVMFGDGSLKPPSGNPWDEELR